MPENEPKDCPPHDWKVTNVDWSYEMETEDAGYHTSYHYYWVETDDLECTKCGETSTSTNRSHVHQEVVFTG